MNCEYHLFNLHSNSELTVCFILPKATHCQVVTVPDDLYMGFVLGSKGQNIADLNKKLSGHCVTFDVGPMYVFE